MGNSLLKQQNHELQLKLLDETQIFALWTISDVRELWKRFQNQIFGFALVEAQFESIIAFKQDVSDHVDLEMLFDILDNDNDGRIDGLELLGGLTLCCNSSFEEKTRFCFELFDFNLNSTLSKKELVMMMMSSVCGLICLIGGGEEMEPDVQAFEYLADECVLRADTNADGLISYEEFLRWARLSRVLMAGVDSLGKISTDAKNEVESEDSAPETDDGDISDTEPAFFKKVKQDSNLINADSNDSVVAKKGDQAYLNNQWKGNVFEPTNLKLKKKSSDGPETNLELNWVFGYRAQNCRSNLVYAGLLDQREDPFIVYYSATLGIVYDSKKQTQRFYMGHQHEITCLAMHSCNTIVATADIKSNIHAWSITSTSITPIIVIQCNIIKCGIKQLVFSPKGDRLGVVGMDFYHTIIIYDFSTGEIIASSKGLTSPNTVYDMAYSSNGNEICIVGKGQIKFFSNVNASCRALETRIGRIGRDGKRHTFFCVTYFKDDPVVGCASGEIYRFKEGQPIQIIQAHGLREPVLCLYYNRVEGTLLSGGKDAMIKTWDSTLQIVGASIDISESLESENKTRNKGFLGCAIISIQQYKDTILVGTKQSDIFEIKLPPNPSELHSITRIAWAHSSGSIRGLAAHPIRDEFATCGDDKTLRLWSIRSHEQTNVRVMPEYAGALSYNPLGDVLCIGMNDGSIALMETNSKALRVYATWKHSAKKISAVKFSPDGKILAAGSADSNIYIYQTDDRKNFRRQAVCKGHFGAIKHIDFSANGQYIQSNGDDCNLLFWDTKGNKVKDPASLRDLLWATVTCTYGWSVQGIWHKESNYNEINACMALTDIGDVVTGDDENRVCLFRFPATTEGCLHQSYIGHSSSVLGVCFNYNRRFCISIGGEDRTILLWKHVMELVESDEEGGDGNSSSGSVLGSVNGVMNIELKDVAYPLASRSLLQEAVNNNQSVEEMIKLAAITAPIKGDQFNPVKPWKSSVVEPSIKISEHAGGSTAVDFQLRWIHGFRCYDSRNNVLYTASGSIVYNAASLAVVYSKSTLKQQFLLGAHSDEVISISNHPAGQIFATGEVGKNPSIIVWDSKDIQVLCKLEGAHLNGVSFLAFNSKGNILASIGLDETSSLCIHDWMKGIKILTTPTEKGKIFCLCFLAMDLVPGLIGSSSGDTNSVINDVTKEVVVTGGVMHLKFWWWQGQNVLSQRALWGRWGREGRKETIICVASAHPSICITGSLSGNIMIWKDFKVFEYYSQV